jgi:hypothetical protein
VSDIVPDQSLLVRDLIRGGAPVRISEKSATQSLRQWDLLAARLVHMGSRVELAGGALPFRRELHEPILDGFARLKARIRRVAAAVPPAERHGSPPVDKFIAETKFLRDNACLFTNVWLNDVLERVRNPSLPAMVNSDGDELVFTTVRYPLKKAADREALARALAAISVLHPGGELQWDWLAPAGEKASVAPEDAQAFAPALDEGSVTLGSIFLEADQLELETNSLLRAQRGRALLEPLVGPFVQEPVVESRTVAEMMASAPKAERKAPTSKPAPQENPRVVHDYLDRYYRKVLDEPVPMLGDVSPRDAARSKSKRQREKLVDWLKFLENSSARQARDSPMAAYDMSWMWEELGVSRSRR